MAEQVGSALGALIVVLLLLVVAIFMVGVAEFTTMYAPELRPTLEKHPYFIWTYRGLDVLTLSFLLLAAVASVASLLREDEGPGVEEEAFIEEGGEE